jgi:adenylate cyclase
MAIDAARLDVLAAALTEAGLAGTSEDDLLARCCTEVRAAGLPVARALVAVDTLHPIHEGRVFRWQVGQNTPNIIEYGRTTSGEAEARWHASPFYHALQLGVSQLHLPITPDSEVRYPVLAELRAAGMTDYLVLLHRFAADGIIGELDCIYTSWTTDSAGGFSETDIQAMEHVVPTLALAVKCASLSRIARTLVETYLGRDAGQRVLAGRIERGVAEPIGAVVWFSDLQGFTRITDTRRRKRSSHCSTTTRTR